MSGTYQSEKDGGELPKLALTHNIELERLDSVQKKNVILKKNPPIYTITNDTILMELCPLIAKKKRATILAPSLVHH